MVINNILEIDSVNKNLDSTLLIMLPFAGGNSYSYNPIIKNLDKYFTILCPEISGRGNMSDHPLFENIDEMVENIYNKWIKPLNLNRKYIFFGHSMGALLSYLLVHKIEEHNRPLPIHMFVSGKSGPTLKKEEITYNLPKNLFYKKLEELGGIPNSALYDDEFMIYFEPIIRADFKAVELFELKKRPPLLKINLTVLYGNDDNISLSDVKRWNMETIGNINYIEFNGGHFFIFNNTEKISNLIKLHI